MASQFKDLPLQSGGGGGAVDSVNGQTGVVILGAVDIDNVPAGNISATDVQGAINELDSEKLSSNIGENDKVLGTSSSGDIQSIPDWSVDTNSGGLYTNLTYQPNDAGGVTFHNNVINFDPLQDSDSDNYNIQSIQANFDINSSGFSQGTTGNAARLLNMYFNHQGTGDIGEINFINSSFEIGNGTDPINVKGASYSYGFGTFHENVNIVGSIQGYGFQPNIDSNATIDTSLNYVTAFYDGSNFGVAPGPYTSFQAGPTIAEIDNNKSYTGLNINPIIPVFNGNSNLNGISISGNIGTFGTGGFNGININPSITDAPYANGVSINMDIDNVDNATGIYVNMTNVTPYPGVQSSLVIQDITFEFYEPGDNDSYQIEYVDDGTAGSETVGISGQLITVHMESGVSTATQLQTAMLANLSFAGAVDITITGVASNAQVAVGPTNFSGGESPGNIKAANFVGDVSIDGDLSFTGALSIGKLNAFATQTIVTGPGTPASVHQMISSPTLAANQTITNGDIMGVNTAALITIGDNSTIATSLLGVTALGLPAVVSMGAGSTIDYVSGAVFAISLDGSATGGTIDVTSLCKSIAIPNGITTVTRLYGYEFSLPFGDPGTDTWGIYMSPDCNNWLKGSLKIGGTAGSTDSVTNSSTALEIESTTKAFLNARMTSTQRDALTAVNGMQIYNSTTDKLQVYASGAWVDLH